MNHHPATPKEACTAVRSTEDRLESAARKDTGGAEHVEAALAELVPDGYFGPVVLPGSGRTVWWTGRIAIGLRYQRPPRVAAAPGGEVWLQALLLDAGRPRRAA